MRIAEYQGRLNKEKDVEGLPGEGRWGCGDAEGAVDMGKPFLSLLH